MSSFYGQIGNIQMTRFQFDKIYSNRRAMDVELIGQKDNIFAGRYVLVNYNNFDFFTLPNVQIGYKFILSGNENFYQDSGGRIPFEYSDFQSFAEQDIDRDSPGADILSKYYFKKGAYFFKMPQGAQYYSQEDYDNYYIPQNSSSSSIVSTGWILREHYGGRLTGNFYECVGHDGSIPQWQKIGNDSNLVFDYLTNYKIDQETYQGNFDERGYNATVWQKVYSGDTGRFVLVARLECTPPAIELYPEAPSLDPVSPYLDAKSTDQVYRIHIPTQWGLQFKEIPNDVSNSENSSGNNNYNKSDQQLQRTDGTSYNADIYMNLGGNNQNIQQMYHQQKVHKDSSTVNEILLTPTGKSGRLYNEEKANDMLELSIHVPIVGNMIDEGYDLIYGSNNDEEQTRPRDILWYYGGDEATNIKKNGDSGIGGKNYDLATLAGSLNTFHSVLGQNIIQLYSKPDTTNLDSYAQNYIYYISNEKKYYRIDKVYQYTELSDSNYTFTPISIDEGMYETDTYYYYESGQYKISKGLISGTTTLYKRNVKNDIYIPVSPAPMGYQSRRYFFRAGVDYICDNAEWPSNPNAQYYTVDETRIYAGTSFTEQYRANLFYYKDENGNYIKDSSPTMVDGRRYQSIAAISATPTIIGKIIYYRPELFFYQAENNTNAPYISCARAYPKVADLPENLKIYCLIFDETQSIVISDNNGSPVLGHPLKKSVLINRNEVALIDYPTNTSNLYYRDDTQNEAYIAFKNIDFTNTPPDSDIPFYAIPANYFTITARELTNLYKPGSYYTMDSNGSYIMSYDALNREETYYLLTKVTPLTRPFYIPGEYYYEKASNDFEVDYTPSFSASRTYYNKDRIFVIADYTSRCPYGYEWNNNSIFVPASVTLAKRSEHLDFVEMKYLDDVEGSVNAHLLSLEHNLKINNDEGRDKETLWGAFNTLKDYLYILHTIKPNQMLMVNDFGQIVSLNIDPQKLKDILTKYDQIMSL